MVETSKTGGDSAGNSVLDELVPFLEAFAAEHKLLPQPAARDTFRRFRCNDRIIEVHLDADNDGKWHIWICVTGSAGGRRYWKRRNLNGPVLRCRLQADLHEALCAAWDELSSWDDETRAD